MNSVAPAINVTPPAKPSAPSSQFMVFIMPTSHRKVIATVTMKDQCGVCSPVNGLLKYSMKI